MKFREKREKKEIIKSKEERKEKEGNRWDEQMSDTLDVGDHDRAEGPRRWRADGNDCSAAGAAADHGRKVEAGAETANAGAPGLSLRFSAAAGVSGPRPIRLGTRLTRWAGRGGRERKREKKEKEKKKKKRGQDNRKGERK